MVSFTKSQRIYMLQQMLFFAVPILLAVCCVMKIWWLVALLLVIFFILTWGIFDIRLALFVKTQNKLPKSDEKQVALTFDDGLSKYTDDVLEILEATKIKATFFIIGNTVATHSRQLMQLKKAGHKIGTHTENHRIAFSFMGMKRARTEVENGIRLTEAVLGEKPLLFRPPFGITNPVIAQIIKKLELKNIGWSLRSLDSRIQNPEKLKRRILRKLKSGKIILLHENRTATIDILPELIAEIKNQGYQFVTLK